MNILSFTYLCHVQHILSKCFIYNIQQLHVKPFFVNLRYKSGHLGNHHCYELHHHQDHHLSAIVRVTSFLHSCTVTFSQFITFNCFINYTKVIPQLRPSSRTADVRDLNAVATLLTTITWTQLSESTFKLEIRLQVTFNIYLFQL